MNIEFHEEAINNFNKKGNELLLQLSLKPKESLPTEFKSKVPVSGEIKKEEILSDFIGSILDPSGEKIATYFQHEDRELGFIGEPFNNYIRLCENIQKVKSVSNYISITTIKSIVFEWCKDKYKGKTNTDLIDYLKSKIEPEIIEREIWFPIFRTEVEEDIKFANVRIITLDDNIIDEWIKVLTQDKDEDNEQKIKKLFNKERKEIEGYAVAIVKTTAEQERAYEIGTNEVEATLDYIRFFSASNFYPKLTSQFIGLGKQHLRIANYFTTIDTKLHFHTKKVIDQGFVPWRIDKQFYGKILNDGLQQIEKLHTSNPRTEFQNRILESLRLYSSGLLLHNLSSRIIYTFTAIESLLLRNQTESIQDSVSRRIAFLISKEKKERQEIAKNFKEVYSMRSKFIHHAEQITHDEFSTLTKFIFNVWSFLLIALHSANFKTKDEFIDSIEDKIYS
jgi:hypothetical protein